MYEQPWLRRLNFNGLKFSGFYLTFVVFVVFSSPISKGHATYCHHFVYVVCPLVVAKLSHFDNCFCNYWANWNHTLQKSYCFDLTKQRQPRKFLVLFGRNFKNLLIWNYTSNLSDLLVRICTNNICVVFHRNFLLPWWSHKG